MQYPIAPLLPTEFSGIDISSGSFVQHNRISKESVQELYRIAIKLAEKALRITVFLEMVDINGQPLGSGNGFFVQHDQIVTNLHVIEGAARGTAKLADKSTTYSIEGVTARDTISSLAILKVARFGIQLLPFGDSDTVETNETVYVAGKPKGIKGELSVGIISGFSERKPNRQFQMTGSISPRSSGGPVLNEEGEVIGISCFTIQDGQSLNFAIPSNYLKVLLNRLEPVIPLSQQQKSVSAKTYFNWGNEKSAIGLYDEAIVNYDKVIQLEPNFTTAYLNRGLAKHKLEQYFAALEDLNSAIQRKPDYVYAYINRGIVKYSLGHSPDAIADFDYAIQLNPELGEAYYNRGIAKASLMRPDDAIVDFDYAIQLDPELSKVYYSRGMVKFIIGNTRDAKSDLQTALKLAIKTGDVNLKSNVESAFLHFAENLYRVGGKAKNNSIKLFITYAHKDIEAKDKLITYLAAMKREGLISIWHDNEIVPGDTWRDSISNTLAETDILFYLVSADSLASKNSNRELAEALNANIRVVPIILEHCNWLNHQLSDFEVLPDKGKPISEWEPEGKGWQNVVAGVRKAIDKMLDQANSPYDISQEEMLAGLEFEGKNILMMLGQIDWVVGAYAAAFDRGNVLVMLEQKDMAIEAYSEAIKLEPRYSVAYTNRGVVYANNGEYDLAIKDFSKAIELNPHDFFTYNNRGNVYNDMGKIDKAIEDFNTAINLNPDYSNAYNNRGNVYVKKHYFEKAIEDFNTAIRLEPDFAGAYNSRGAAYHEKGNLEKAIEDFGTAIKLDPNYVSPYINRGRIHGRKSMLPEAINDFSKVIMLKPDYAEAYYNRGVAHGKKRDFDLAIMDYTKAIELNPNYTDAYCNRGSAYLSKGEFDLAIADYTKAIELDPGSGELYCNRGLAWLVLQNWHKASEDIASAKRVGLDVAGWFHKLYKSVADFERIIGTKLPENITAMLTPQYNR